MSKINKWPRISALRQALSQRPSRKALSEALNLRGPSQRPSALRARAQAIWEALRPSGQAQRLRLRPSGRPSGPQDRLRGSTLGGSEALLRGSALRPSHSRFRQAPATWETPLGKH